MSTANTAEILRILSTLIGFPTTFHDSNLGMIEWIRDDLASQGIAARLIYDPDSRKANLLASIGPPSDSGVVLSGHTDVVPTTGQQWESEPFRASQRDDRLHGRGACDMKGFIATVLAQVPYWRELPLRRPLHLAFTYDEEAGCIGVRSLLADMESIGMRASGCIVGEPTSMEPVVAHKGRICGHCTVQGKAVHSAQAPDGVNAIAYAARMIGFIDRLAHRESLLGLRDSGFDVPFSTLATTLVRGGSAQNIIPSQCEFSFDYRYLPGIDPSGLFDALATFKDELVEEMRRLDPRCDIRLQREETALPFDTAEQSSLARLVKALNRTSISRKAAFSTEAGYFERYGIAAIVCGPGSIEQAHRPNEYIEVSQLSACARFLTRLGDWMCDDARGAGEGGYEYDNH